MQTRSDGRAKWRTLVVYAALLAVSVSLFMAVRTIGERLIGQAAAVPPPPPAAPAHRGVVHVLLSLLVIVVAARGLGVLFRLVRQPLVVGEIAAGILIGPSLLGRVAPELQQVLVPPSIVPALGVVAQVGVVLYMFLVGLDLDTASLSGKKSTGIAVSHASIAVPMVFGAALAIWLYPRFAPAGVTFTAFSLFLGVAMSVTAFPVLARILRDTGLAATPLGAIALTCAAADDVTAWCLLAVVVSLARADVGSAVPTVLLTVGFVAAMVLLARPATRWLVQRQERRQDLTHGTLAVVFVGLLASALATELIGIHALFGAFLFGCLIPFDSSLARGVKEKLEDVVVVLFLPVFFAFTGMRTDLGLMADAQHWGACLLIIAVATLGKVGGSVAAARATGLSWQHAATLGALMNTRGLMELVVLNVGLDLGVLSPTLFAMMVVMAVVTTLTTTPAVHWLKVVPADQAAGPSRRIS